LSLSPEVEAATELVVGNLNEDGYLTASDEELVEALLQSRGPERPEPIPFERGNKGRLAHLWDKAEKCENVPDTPEDEALEIAAAADEDVAFLLAAVREARALVNFLDPVGVGARDLRECLLIQICAQQGEAALPFVGGAFGAVGHPDPVLQRRRFGTRRARQERAAGQDQPGIGWQPG